MAKIILHRTSPDGEIYYSDHLLLHLNSLTRYALKINLILY